MLALFAVISLWVTITVSVMVLLTTVVVMLLGAGGARVISAAGLGTC